MNLNQLIPHAVHLTETNLKKLANSINNGVEAVVQLAKEHLNGDHVIPFLKNQYNKIHKAIKIGKGLRIKFTPTHLRRIVRGGFLPALLPFLAETILPALTGTVLPALATGALTGAASYGASKLLNKAAGNGLTNFGTRGGCTCGNGVKKKTARGLYQFGQIPRKM